MTTARMPRVSRSLRVRGARRSARHASPAVGQPASRAPKTTATAAAVLSILGSMLVIGIAALGLLVVPIAALVVFGPALLELL